MKFSLLLLLGMLLFCHGYSQTGSFDTAFGDAGTVKLKLGYPNFSVGAVAVQSDGKVLVAGGAFNATDDFYVTRFLADGTVDKNFGGSGVAYADMSGSDKAVKIIVLADNRFLIAGQSYQTGTSRSYVIRYTKDGQRDKTYGQSGTVYIDAEFKDMVLLPDGKLIVAHGGSQNLMCFSADGVRDNKYTTAINPSDASFRTSALSLSSKGNILATGYYGWSLDQQFLACLNPDGTLDKSFGEKGVTLFSGLGTSNFMKVNLAQSNDGNIGILFDDGSNQQRSYFKFSASGKIYNTGTSGLLKIPMDKTRFYGFRCVFDQDGAIYIAGTARNDQQVNQFAVLKFDSDGKPVPTFGAAGQSTTLFSGTRHEAEIPFVRPDGSIIVAGFDYAEGRYQAAVGLFSIDGKQVANFATGINSSIAAGTGKSKNGLGKGIIVAPDGSMHVAGLVRNGEGISLVVAKLKADGKLDESFGEGGRVHGSLEQNHETLYDFYLSIDGNQLQMAEDGSGNIYVMTTEQDYFRGKVGPTLFRFTPDGKPDIAFGGRGKLHIPLSEDSREGFPLGLAFQKNGQLIIGLSERYGTLDSRRLQLRRVNTNGTFDKSFGTDGVLIDPQFYGQRGERSKACRLVIDKQDRIVLAGSYGLYGFNNFAIVRYTASGELDKSFNGGMVTPQWPGNYVVGHAIVLQEDGKILAAGCDAPSSTIKMVRYLPTGALDPDFGEDGLVNKLTVAGQVSRLALQSDGKILYCTGKYTSDIALDYGYMHVGRLNPDGSIDRTFGNNGDIRVSRATVMQDKNGDMGIAADGRIFLVGSTELEPEFGIHQDMVVYGLQNKMEPFKPELLSFDPPMAGSGASITVEGVGLIGMTKISVGGTPVKSFVVKSSSQVVLVLGDGATGDVTAEIGSQKISIPGFTYVPRPIITPDVSLGLIKGNSVLLQTPAYPGFTYTWYRYIDIVQSGSSPTYRTSQAGAYTVKITKDGFTDTSLPAFVTVDFALPADNFTISATSASCRGTNDGSISLTAKNSMNYTAMLTLAGIKTEKSFTDKVSFDQLAAGTYELCLQVSGEKDFKQCFTLVVTEPEKLSVFSMLTENTSKLTLQLAGADRYYIQLNGKLFTTSANEFELQMESGANKITISSDKNCQGIWEREIINSNTLMAYPNPVQDILYLNLGNTGTEKKIFIYNTTGQCIYQDKVTQTVTSQINMRDMVPGIYLLRIKTEKDEKTFKIVKR
ncbi:T9SS type A sorting domain-containing protein [Pedobacter sp. ISL-68]|uniref:T9SS type A sorting domain-containing protein n=1 Tax=unclassified Pedobacter TaxID=2628915 RepID=UPI001BEA51F6|nr:MULTISPECIES: T9SS type A sorting domain-containing protein [unclassified Pedobacter]MBT2560496.1 T9SS type A sorting domain-containing protein [Pedobacter sp. ISL-64]MBT2593229.1 T9SS type A sorting domain-containing protein [Pedobacter sp. ISL-68]